ncbi:bifunctional oligoribonuclease/PAP phosphatase NrnA [bacterium D16-34]|nr:bifunctional oligoribonuclease/PAP phosphatase NrnA [bacterium D16-34]
MTCTSQTNTTLDKIAHALKDCNSFVICGHVSPDGDCLGSQLALAAALRQLGKHVTCVLAKDEPIEANLRFLPGAHALVYAGEFSGEVDAFIGVDVPTRERIGAALELHDRARICFTIDHHAHDLTMADYVYVDPDAASTTVLIWQLCELLGVNRAGDITTCCYTGLVTDTGCFQYQNANEEAFSCALSMVQSGAQPAEICREIFQNRSLASIKLESVAIDRMLIQNEGQSALSWLTLEDFERCDAVKADAEPLINTLRSVAGVRVACMLRQQSDCIRGSLRAKDNTDVASLAKRLNGGGHKAAAGFTLYCSMDEAIKTMQELLFEVVKQA